MMKSVCMKAKPNIEVDGHSNYWFAMDSVDEYPSHWIWRVGNVAIPISGKMVNLLQKKLERGFRIIWDRASWLDQTCSS